MFRKKILGLAAGFMLLGAPLASAEAELSHAGAIETASPMFGLGEESASKNFTGRVFLQALAKEGGVTVANVTFEAGCINAWHVHDHVQILLGVMGRGWAEREGEAAEELRPGSVFVIPAGVKHWHGASRSEAFTHTAISGPVAEGFEPYGTRWLEPVSAIDYVRLK